MRIAIDAMGGDLGVPAILGGARLAWKTFPDIEILLIGDEEKIRRQMDTMGWNSSERVEIRHASEHLEMHDTLADIRKKRDSSITGAVSAVRKKDADVCIAVGNTLAAVAVSTFTYGRIKGIKQPGIIVNMPSLTETGICMMIDMGASVNPVPESLFMYAVMSNIYARYMYDLESPRIGLLSVGEEDSKGSTMSKKVFELLSEADLNFIGNVEGGDYIRGEVDVIVCDGFTGNAVLKSAEYTATAIMNQLKDGIRRSWKAKLGALLLKDVFRKMKRRMDWRENAGGLLLGLRGITVISHGRADEFAILKCFEAARKLVKVRLIDNIERAVTKALPLLEKH